ncbi:hypothetical protein JHK85_002860 [Glycine max]|nr:hypothetical protein JHK85_002860 [Glycine max]
MLFAAIPSIHNLIFGLIVFYILGYNNLMFATIYQNSKFILELRIGWDGVSITPLMVNPAPSDSAHWVLSQQFPNPNEVVPPESNEQQRLLRISLRICGTVVESLPMARCAPKCEKTVQALLCRNLNVKSATLPNATSSRRIRLQDDLGTKFHLLLLCKKGVSFPPGVLRANASYAPALALNSLAQALSKPVKAFNIAPTRTEISFSNKDYFFLFCTLGSFGRKTELRTG